MERIRLKIINIDVEEKPTGEIQLEQVLVLKVVQFFLALKKIII